MKKLRKKNTKLFILILLLLLGIGFAALAANLKIDGTVSVHKVNWDVHFENVEVTQGSVAANPAPTSDNETTREMNYAIRFSNPGDFYEFTVDIVNGGTINAMLNSVVNKVYETGTDHEINLPAYLTNTVTYIDGTPIQQNQVLKRGTREKIKVRIEFKTDVDPSDLPKTGDESVEFKFEEDYKQADGNATDVRPTVDFQSSTIDQILISYYNGQLDPLEDAMEAGTLREVQLDMDNDGTPETTSYLRIANLTTPSECNTQGFSQTACGLVLEFSEIIARHRMNPWTDGSVIGDGNNGGWEHSDMRNYVNSVIYNALPPEIKSRIIDTTVVSGYGPKDSANFVTTDKIYLFTFKEVIGAEGSNNRLSWDTSSDLSRQLDYYHAKGVNWNQETYAPVYKQLNGSTIAWWLRSSTVGDLGFFNNIHFESQSAHASTSCYADLGVSPAFRMR